MIRPSQLTAVIFLTGFLAFISGCRIGNYIENASPPPANPDHISGYYLAHPQELIFSVTTQQTLQAQAPTYLIPTEVSGTMTNPAALLMKDLQSGSALLGNYAGKNALPIEVSSALAVSASWTTTPQTYWLDPACQSNLAVSIHGTLVQSPSMAAPAGTVATVSGALQIEFDVSTQFQGSCAPTFQTIANCYQNASDCGATTDSDNQQLQAYAQTLFGPLIQLNLITVPEIAQITNYAYQVSYQ
jgi:hypothetical protein